MNFPSVANFSIAKGTGGTNPPEMYVPLWWYSGATITSSATSNSPASAALQRGATGAAGTTSANNLYKLNSSWLPNTKYAFEATIFMQSGAVTANAGLWDMTSNVAVSNSQISTTSTTATVIRSSQFTLTPGHIYGVTLWNSGTTGYTLYITDASLIVFPS